MPASLRQGITAILMQCRSRVCMFKFSLINLITTVQPRLNDTLARSWLVCIQFHIQVALHVATFLKSFLKVTIVLTCSVCLVWHDSNLFYNQLTI